MEIKVGNKGSRKCPYLNTSPFEAEPFNCETAVVVLVPIVCHSSANIYSIFWLEMRGFVGWSESWYVTYHVNSLPCASARAPPCVTGLWEGCRIKHWRERCPSEVSKCYCRSSTRLWLEPVQTFREWTMPTSPSGGSLPIRRKAESSHCMTWQWEDCKVYEPVLLFKIEMDMLLASKAWDVFAAWFTVKTVSFM